MNSVLGYEIRTLFDPIQTHAAYGVPIEQVPLVKVELKKRGASRFRIVKVRGMQLAIVCYKSCE